MAEKFTIATYRLEWNTQTSSGHIRLRGAEGEYARIDVGSCAELDALGTILRNEKPVSYNTDTCVLVAGYEPVGEEEN